MVEKVPENYVDVNRDKIWSNDSVSTPQFAVPSNGGRAMNNRTMNSQFSILNAQDNCKQNDKRRRHILSILIT